MMNKLVKIFLNYAREDEPRVEKLHRSLKSAGFDPWMDRHSILPGEDWQQAITNAIRRSDFFVPCISSRSVSKTGVLEGEIKTALGVWRERRRSDIFLIPVRLEHCTVPKDLERLQWVDLFDDADWTRLAEAVRGAVRRRVVSRRRVVAAGTMAAAAAGAAYLWQGRAIPRWAADRAGIGVTVWRLRPSTQDDPPGSKILVRRGAEAAWTPIRVTGNATFQLGDRVRFGIEASKEGYLYVVNRELHADGTLGQPHLIFPALGISQGRNRMAAGRLLELPPWNEQEPYWTLQAFEPGYAGEHFTVLVTREPLPGVEPADNGQPLSEEVVAYWRKRWHSPFQAVQTSEFLGQPPTEAERRAATDERATLTQADRPPQTFYELTAGPKDAWLIEFSLPVKPVGP